MAASGNAGFVETDTNGVLRPIVFSNTVSTQTLAVGSNTLDCSTANEFRITLPAGNVTLVLANPVDGQEVEFFIKQDSVGSRTVTWPTSVTWAGGSAPTLTVTANFMDFITLKFNALTGKWHNNGAPVLNFAS